MTNKIVPMDIRTEEDFARAVLDARMPDGWSRGTVCVRERLKDLHEENARLVNSIAELRGQLYGLREFLGIEVVSTQQRLRRVPWYRRLFG